MEQTNNALHFKGNDPGAVQYGNFINYYSFHPPEERISLLPHNIWYFEKPYTLLDIGCNTGELSREVMNFLSKQLSAEINMLGVDIDPTLICRAQELTNDERITFRCLDVMDTTVCKTVLNDYLTSKCAPKFSVIFCFSTTMWIHLNYGDSGLKVFLKYISSIAEMLVIEPQPWKCYRNAVRRLKRQDFEFSNFSKLTVRDNIEDEIERILTDECELTKIEESPKTKWQRKLLIFRKKK